jgi:hypothetical protein
MIRTGQWRKSRFYSTLLKIPADTVIKSSPDSRARVIKSDSGRKKFVTRLKEWGLKCRLMAAIYGGAKKGYGEDVSTLGSESLTLQLPNWERRSINVTVLKVLIIKYTIKLSIQNR